LGGCLLRFVSLEVANRGDHHVGVPGSRHQPLPVGTLLCEPLAESQCLGAGNPAAIGAEGCEVILRIRKLAACQAGFELALDLHRMLRASVRDEPVDLLLSRATAWRTEADPVQVLGECGGVFRAELLRDLAQVCCSDLAWLRGKTLPEIADVAGYRRLAALKRVQRGEPFGDFVLSPATDLVDGRCGGRRCSRGGGGLRRRRRCGRWRSGFSAGLSRSFVHVRTVIRAYSRIPGHEVVAAIVGIGVQRAVHVVKCGAFKRLQIIFRLEAHCLLLFRSPAVRREKWQIGISVNVNGDVVRPRLRSRLSGQGQNSFDHADLSALGRCLCDGQRHVVVGTPDKPELAL
jgi:hypothetical protein